MDEILYSLVTLVFLFVFLIMSYQFYKNINTANILYLGPGNQSKDWPGSHLQPSRYANEYTFSSFIYIADNVFEDSRPKILFTKGAKGAEGAKGVEGAKEVKLQGKTNTFSIKLDNNPITVKDIPVGRWFHFALVVRDSYASIYIDSELKHYTNLTNKTSGINVSNPITINPNESFNLAKFQYFSTALSSHEVREIYDNGPQPGLGDTFNGMLKNILVDSPEESETVKKCATK